MSMIEDNDEDTKEFFLKLDEDFLASQNGPSKPIVWQGRDIVVGTYYELPIPVDVPGSTITYSFTTTGGDIAFEVILCTTALDGAPSTEAGTDKAPAPEIDEADCDVIVPSSRVPSDRSEVTGSLVAEACGYYVLQFDNSFSWLRSKALAYRVTLQQPVIDAEADRCLRSVHLLRAVAEDSAMVQAACDAMSEQCAEVEAELPELEAQVAALQAEIAARRELLVGAEQEMGGMLQRLRGNDRKLTGLGVRCLDRSVLTHVFSFIVGERGAGVGSSSPASSGSRNSLAVRRACHDDAISLMSVSRHWLKVLLCNNLGARPQGQAEEPASEEDPADRNVRSSAGAASSLR